MASTLRALGLFAILLVGLWATACAGGGTTNTTIPTVGEGTAATTPAGGGATSTFGAVQVNLNVQKSAGAQPVPNTFKTAIFKGYTKSEALVFTSASLPVSAKIVVPNVPTTVVTMNIQYFDALNKLVGQSTVPVVLQALQTYVLDNPSYDAVVAGTNALLRGTYTLTGADSGSVAGGLLNGSLVFDGNGKVTGAITRKDATATPPPTSTFTITTGTYSVDASRNVSVDLTTSLFPLHLRGRASLNTNGQSVYSAIYGDGTNNALSGYAQMQMQGVSTPTLSGRLFVSGFSVGFFGTTGYYSGELNIDGNGAITGGSITNPAGTKLAISGGTYSGSGGALSGSMNVSSLGTVPFTGSVGADGTLCFNGVSSTSNDFLFFAGLPDPVLVKVPNVPGTMAVEGMRSVTGGLTGSATINVGAGTIAGGSFNEFQANVVPIVTDTRNIAASTFSIATNGVVTGVSTAPAGEPAVRLVQGFFTNDGSVYFGALDAGVAPLQGGQAFAVLAK